MLRKRAERERCGREIISLNEEWSELAFTSEDAVLQFSRIAERMLLFLRTGTGMGLHPASGATVPL